jgi:hypothetical protein
MALTGKDIQKIKELVNARIKSELRPVLKTDSGSILAEAIYASQIPALVNGIADDVEKVIG